MKPLFLMCVPCGAAASSNLEELQPQQRETFFFLFMTAILRCIPKFEGRSVSGISRHRSQKSLRGSCFPTNTELRHIAAIYGSVAALAVRRVGVGMGERMGGGECYAECHREASELLPSSSESRPSSGRGGCAANDSALCLI